MGEGEAARRSSSPSAPDNGTASSHGIPPVPQAGLVPDGDFQPPVKASHAAVVPDGALALGHEAREVWRLSWVTMLTYFLNLGMGAVDLAFVGRIGRHELAAVAIGNLWTESTFFIAIGIATALDSLVSQAWGARNHARIGLVVQRCIFIMAVFTVPLGTAWFVTEDLMRAAGQDPDVTRLTGVYTRVQVAGVVPFCMHQVLMKWLQGMGNVRPALYVGISANILNVVFNQILIFGLGPITGLGFAGAPIATVLARWSMFLLIAGYMLAFGLWKDSWIRPSREIFDLAGLLEFMSLAAGAAAMLCSEAWGFNVTTLIVGYLGVLALDVHAACMTLMIMLWTFALGISVSAGQRVGFHLGSGHPRNAIQSVKLCLALSAVVSSAIALLFYLVRHDLGRIFTDDEEVVAGVSDIAWLLAATSLVDAVQTVMQGVVRGMARNTLGAGLNLVAYFVIGIPIGAYMAFLGGYGLFGVWYGLCIGISFMLLFLSVFLYRLNWRGEADKAVARSSVAPSMVLA